MPVHRLLSLVPCFALVAAEPEVPPPASGSATPAAEAETPVLDDAAFRFDQATGQTPAPAKRWSAGLALSGGYDSNILRQNADLPTASDAKGFAWSLEGQAQVRAIDGASGRITLGGTGGLDQYPSEHRADLLRIGGFVSATWIPNWHAIEPGAVVSHHRFWLDGRSSATATTVNGFITRISGQHVSIAGISVQHLTYEITPQSSGDLLDVSYRHWYLFQPEAVSRRIEAGMRLGTYRADEDPDRYRVLTPSLALFYRVLGGSRPEAGTLDVQARGSLDFRRYDPTAAGNTHRLHQWQSYLHADWWWNTWLSTGPYLAYSTRSSTATTEDYHRYQAGLRLAAAW